MRKFFFLLCCLCGGLCFSQTALYVSPDGNDDSEGTRPDAPLKSIARAQSILNSQGDRNQGATVTLLPGTYYLEETLEFGPQDGGNEGNTVTYRAEEPGTVVVSGGRLVSTANAREENGLIVIPLAADPFRQLYVSGRKATRSRHPNVDFFATAGWDLDDGYVLLSGNFIEMLSEAKYAEAHMIQSWSTNYLRIKETKLQTAGGYKEYTALTLQDREADILFNRPYPPHKESHRIMLQNALAFVDSPGEWYHDRDKEELYYQPRPGERPDNIEMIIPTLETLVAVHGTADEPVSNLVFEHLHFRHSNWLEPSLKGYLNCQAGQPNWKATKQNEQYVTRPAAAVEVIYGRNIQLRRNLFTDLGSTGVDLHYGTDHCVVEGNVFNGIAGSAVLVSKFSQDKDTEVHIAYNPEDEREICTDDKISNNLIEDIATEYLGCLGIGAPYPRRIEISHNVIKNLPYSGISLGFGWHSDPNPMEDNVIAFNDISRVMQTLNDGGAIYTLSLQPGTHIYRNYIHHISPPSQLGQKLLRGVYLDERSGGTRDKPMFVEENLIANNIPDRFNFHIPTWVLVNATIHRFSQGHGPELETQVGLEAEFRDMEKYVPKK